MTLEKPVAFIIKTIALTTPVQFPLNGSNGSNGTVPIMQQDGSGRSRTPKDGASTAWCVPIPPYARHTVVSGPHIGCTLSTSTRYLHRFSKHKRVRARQSGPARESKAPPYDVIGRHPETPSYFRYI
eukprot:SAG11_NODE_589_length_8326_cov_11.644099_7_plen_127_part_00